MFGAYFLRSSQQPRDLLLGTTCPLGKLFLAAYNFYGASNMWAKI